MKDIKVLGSGCANCKSTMALIEAVAETTMAALASPPAEAPWDEQLTVLASSFRDIARAHPAVLRTLMTDERPPTLLRVADEIVTRLVELGFAPEDAAAVLRTFVRYLIGSAVMETSGRIPAEELEQAFDEGLTLLLTGAAGLRSR